MKYNHTIDSSRQPDVPRGKLSRHTFRSEIFQGTTRDYWLYVPASYEPSKPAALMVFQDGHLYVNEEGPFRVLSSSTTSSIAGRCP